MIGGSSSLRMLDVTTGWVQRRRNSGIFLSPSPIDAGAGGSYFDGS
jgi:hypothetical protein